MQIVSCGPESDKEESQRSMMKMITGEKESIFIQTPYLVPDTPMLDSLAMAARSGLDVRIMIPAMPDHPFVYRTTLYNAGRLIQWAFPAATATPERTTGKPSPTPAWGRPPPRAAPPLPCSRCLPSRSGDPRSTTGTAPHPRHDPIPDPRRPASQNQCRSLKQP